MKGIGLMIKLKVKVFIFIEKGLVIQESGYKICSMDMGWRDGSIMHLMLGHTKTDIKMAMANSYGVMQEFTKENLRITILMVRGYIFGMMEGNIRANGRIIKCMGEDYFHGLMADNMKGNI